MGLTIDIVQCGDVRVDASFLTKYRRPGEATIARTTACLIQGHPEGPLLVDTGFRNPQVMAMVGMEARVPEGGGLGAELAARGLKFEDVRHVLHTHLHIDHAGQDDLFPDTSTVIVNRRELELGCGGSGGGGYPAADMKHLLSRVWRRNSIRLLDLDPGDLLELFPRIAVELAGGHTEGSINVLVETDDGVARICGDVFYDLQTQIVSPFEETAAREPHVSGNTAMSERAERRSMKHAAAGCTWLLPCHDAPARMQTGEVVGRVVGACVPGPVISPEDFIEHHADLAPRFAKAGA